MVRKKVDERIRTLIENGVKSRTRSFFVIVGDRGKDQVVNLHYILSKAQVKARPSVLWCYNKELGFSTHRQKRMRAIKKAQQRGVYDNENEDPFELFMSSTNIRWCYYKETQKILGATYGMNVLQDFEAITPNILCRTIETVEGGGVVVLLLHSMSSLKQLYTLTMEAHSRFRTDAHQDVVGRFNERFILSLASCLSCLVLDDELNVLPVSRHAKAIVPLSLPAASGGGAGGDWDEEARGVEVLQTEAERELTALKGQLAETELVGGLVNLTRTLDQAKAVLTFSEAIAEKTLRSTVALTAGRGRGKSAALGLSIAAAVGYGYSNIFVTSPSPENLGTLFEFVVKGLEALAFKEHTDFEAVASTNPDFNKAIVRINIFKGHRQTIQYISPGDSEKLAQAELLVVDEAAAIPLPLVKKLLGPYLVFLASTVNGYEGTGRSLSLKLIQQLRQQQAASVTAAAALAGAAATKTGVAIASGATDPWAAAAAPKAAAPAPAPGPLSGGARSFREVILAEPIRYAPGDAIEAWLNDLLCLDATSAFKLSGRLPAPQECELYAVDRDALFSYHKLSEGFLHRMMSLFVSSHYKNTPNDLQLMSDAPAQRLFVLLGPTKDADAAALPDILCVVQVALEGRISQDSLRAQLARGARSSGDLIPWTLSQQFQDDGFASLSGARVVRVASHPDATRMGYGTRALDLLCRYFEGKMVTLTDSEDGDDEVLGGVDRGRFSGAGDEEEAGLAAEKLKPRKQLPPLLVNVSDIHRPERIHWLGVSYGMTLQLFNFWRRGGYLPVYLRQTANDLTAEHTLIMLRPLDTSDLGEAALVPGSRVANPKAGWHVGFVADFARRFLTLLSYDFRQLDTTLALSVVDAAASVLGVQSGSGKEEGEGEGSSSGGGAGSASTALVAAVGSRAVTAPLSARELPSFFSPHDLKRLESYSRNLVDYHMILDLLPDLARLYFQGRLPVGLPRLQAGILLGMGPQRCPVEALAAHFDIATNQVLALFNKAVRKMSLALAAIHEKGIEEEMFGSKPAATAVGGAAAAGSSAKKAPAPAAAAVASPAAAAAAPAPVISKAAQSALLADPELKRYVVPADEKAWAKALAGKAPGEGSLISVQRDAAAAAAVAADADGALAGKKRKADGPPPAASEDIYDPGNRLAGKHKHKKAKSAQ